MGLGRPHERGGGLSRAGNRGGFKWEGGVSRFGLVGPDLKFNPSHLKSQRFKVVATAAAISMLNFNRLRGDLAAILESTVVHENITYIKNCVANYFLARLQLQLHKELLREIIFACASVSHGKKPSITITA